MLTCPPGFLRGLYPRPVHQVVPLVRPADVEVHDDPGHRELRERVDVRQRERAEYLHIQHGRERRQKRQPEVEEHKEDRRRYDECSLAFDQFFEGRGPLYANPLVVALHPSPLPLSLTVPHYMGCLVYSQAYTPQRTRQPMCGQKRTPRPEGAGGLDGPVSPPLLAPWPRPWPPRAGRPGLPGRGWAGGR